MFEALNHSIVGRARRDGHLELNAVQLRDFAIIHQPLISGQYYGPATDVQIQADEMLRIRQELNRILAKHTGRTEEEIERDTDRDNHSP